MWQTIWVLLVFFLSPFWIYFVVKFGAYAFLRARFLFEQDTKEK